MISARVLCVLSGCQCWCEMCARIVRRECWSVPRLLPFDSITFQTYLYWHRRLFISSALLVASFFAQFVGAVNELYALDIACGAAHVCMIVSATGRGAAAEAQLAAFPEVQYCVCVCLMDCRVCICLMDYMTYLRVAALLSYVLIDTMVKLLSNHNCACVSVLASPSPCAFDPR